MIKNIAHIGLTVRDLDRSVEFYRVYLDLTTRDLCIWKESQLIGFSMGKI